MPDHRVLLHRRSLHRDLLDLFDVQRFDPAREWTLAYAQMAIPVYWDTNLYATFYPPIAPDLNAMPQPETCLDAALKRTFCVTLMVLIDSTGADTLSAACPE